MPERGVRPPDWMLITVRMWLLPGAVEQACDRVGDALTR